MSLDVKSYSCFNGCHYKKWVDQMIPLLGIVDLKDILEGTLIAPATAILEPTIPTRTPATGTAAAVAPTSQDWSLYNAQLGQFDRYSKALEKYSKQHGEALGVLNQSLDNGIWEQVKDMTPAQAWAWLCTTYATQQFVEVLEDFKILTSFKIDLSNPNPQLAKFRFHYTQIPISPAVPASTTVPVAIPATPFISPSMAALILLSALPLSSDPTQDSVYQRMMEDYTASYTVPNMNLDTLTNAICNTWASRFGHLSESQKPRKGTFYIPKRDKAPPKKLQANITSAIKDKPSPPTYSDQYKTGSLQDKGKARADPPSKSADEKKKKNHCPT
jgi:hypothetical protein